MHTVVIHAHCYQPPREDPWLEVVDAEPSAVPDHDWNARIDRECYARLASAEVRAPDPRAAARDPDARGGLARIVNLYGWCSFDVGPTLCEWMDSSSNTFDAMRRGDEASVRRWGHGNAIAAPFHHVILPLASRRDKITEVRWGIADFRRRFGREPEGMWLPECAVDEETLEILALEGIRFTILAPYQVRTDAPHHGRPVKWNAGGGRHVAILPYDGSLAGDVAFGGLLRSPSALVSRFTAHANGDGHTYTTLATDGETFGHHHAGGDVVLAEALAVLSAQDKVRVRNAACVVAEADEMELAELVSPSSWSCAHGVERWRSNCGCRLDTSQPTSQQWRAPLRESLEKLAARCHRQFEEEGRTLFARDPWDVRDAYGSVVARSNEEMEQFVAGELRADASGDAQASSLSRARELLELERAAMRTFTSCAWFFDDVARIETRQVLRYAARALELSGNAARLSHELIDGLRHAHSNVAHGGTGADLFVREALPHSHPALRAAAGLIALRAVGATDTARIGAYRGVSGEGDTLIVTHMRTGRTVHVRGTIEGDGPALSVHLQRLQDGHDPAEFRIGVRDLPESAAREVLRRSQDSDAALELNDN